MRANVGDAALIEERMMPPEKSDPSVTPKIKKAIAFLIEQSADLQAAAAHAGMETYELRRQMGRPHVRRYALAQRQLALDAFCLGSPAALTAIRDTSENSMARVQAIKAGEQLRVGALEEEGRAQKRAPGLQIVIMSNDGKEVAYHPPQPPMLDVTPKPAAEPISADADAE
jgi:hypothetical protein